MCLCSGETNAKMKTEIQYLKLKKNWKTAWCFTWKTQQPYTEGMLVSTNMKAKSMLFQTVTEKSCVRLTYNVITPRDTNSSNPEHLASSRKEFTWKGLFWINLPGFENRHHQVPPQKLFLPRWCPTSHVAPVSYSAGVQDAHWPRAAEGW